MFQVGYEIKSLTDKPAPADVEVTVYGWGMSSLGSFGVLLSFPYATRCTTPEH